MPNGPFQSSSVSQVPPRGDVVFVHGLWLTGAESFLLRRRLAAAGLRLHPFPYSSLNESLGLVIDRCAAFANALADRDPPLPVHFVGHSLGGVVLHRLFEKGYRATPGARVVLLGPPLRGCAAGRRFAELAGGRGRGLLGSIARDELLRDCDRRWNSGVPLGIIAGTRPFGLARLVVPVAGEHDGVVRVSETQLPGATGFVKLPVAHSEMLFSARVAEEITAFLATGHFTPR
jgi:pimeloyl-ACP methyl ester carboxylesterase